MDEESLSRVAELGLRPLPWDPERGRFQWLAGVDYSARYRGSLLAGAIGDALGRPAEGRSADDVARRFGLIKEFQPWHGWTGGPAGTITDDTQLTMVVAASLIANRAV